MVGNVGSTSTHINMSSLNSQQNSMGPQKGQAPQGPPPPPPSGGSAGPSEDPLGVFNSVDADSDGTISESEYDILTQGISEVTGSEPDSGFLDFDSDGDGSLNGAELRSVLDEAGFAPPPPPSRQVMSAYENQSGEVTGSPMAGDSLMPQLLGYLENRSGDIDISA